MGSSDSKQPLDRDQEARKIKEQIKREQDDMNHRLQVLGEAIDNKLGTKGASLQKRVTALQKKLNTEISLREKPEPINNKKQRWDKTKKEIEDGINSIKAMI